MRTTIARGLTAVALVAGLVSTGEPAVAASGRAWTLNSAGRMPGSNISAVASSRPWDAWAVGSQAEAGSGVPQGVLLHWQGRRWRRVPAAGLPEVGTWHSVATSSPRNVWVYGWSQVKQSVAHFDGRRWREVAMPRDVVTYGFAKLAVAPGATWLADARWAARRVGNGWRSTPFPEGVTVTAIEARSAREVWVAGYRWSITGNPQARPYAARWDGRRFVAVATPDNGMFVRDLYVDRHRNVWLTGQIPQGEGHRPVVLRWNGRRWRDLGLPDQNQWPNAISVSRSGKVWVAGDPEGFEGPTAFWGYDARGWRTVTAQLPPGAFAPSVSGLAPIPGTNRMWAVGTYHKVVGPGSSQSYESIHLYR